METQPFIDSLQRQVAVAAEASGDDARALAERLTAPLDAAIRLMLLEVLASAAEEITCDLAPGSVEVRLRGREPEFVVTAPPAERSADYSAAGPPRDPDLPSAGLLPRDIEGDQGGISRINLRMPDHLKARVETAAGAEGLSVNAWLVRAAAAALSPTGPDRAAEARAHRGGQRYTGWSR